MKNVAVRCVIKLKVVSALNVIKNDKLSKRQRTGNSFYNSAEHQSTMSIEYHKVQLRRIKIKTFSPEVCFQKLIKLYN